MAVLIPLALNSSGGAPAYSAETFRREITALLATAADAVTARSGIFDPRSLVLSLSGSTLNAASGLCVIGTAKGAYLTGCDATTEVGAVAAHDATNPRIDRAILEVLDPDNGSGGTAREGRLRLVQGVAAAVPSMPALPANSLHLGSVYTPAVSGARVLTIDPQFTAAAGAPVPVRNVGERDALNTFEGLQAKRLDLRGSVETWVNAKWDGYLNQDLVLAAGYELTHVDAPLNVSVRGSMATLTGMVKRTSGTGLTVATLPASARPARNTRFPFLATNTGGSDGPRGYAVVDKTGTIALNVLSGSPAWTTSSWFPLNASWPVA